MGGDFAWTGAGMVGNKEAGIMRKLSDKLLLTLHDAG